MIIMLKFPSRMNRCNTKCISFHPSTWSVVIPITTEYNTPQSHHTGILNFQNILNVVHIVIGWRRNTSIISCPRMTFPCECVSSCTIFWIWFDHKVWSPHKLAYPIIEHFTSGQTFSHLWWKKCYWYVISQNI